MTWGIFKSDSVSEAYKKMKAEELKGKQHKLDVDKDGKIEGEDLAKLRKEEKVDEAMQKSDVPAYLRKEKGEKPLTVADVKGARKDSISHKDNLAKARNEEVEQLDELSPSTLKSYVKGAKDDVAAHKDQKSSAMDQGDHKTASDSAAAIAKRQTGMKTAKAKLNKEDLDIFSESEIDNLINEVLKASDDAGKWISDFTKSDDPRFSGDSKEQRKKRALAAYYAAQKNESVDYDSFLEEEAQGDIVKMSAKKIKHGNIEDKDDEKDVMEPNSEGEADFLDKHSVSVTDEPAAAAGNDQSGKDKVATATGPKGQGAGKYDGKGKTGVKESKDCSSEDDSETNEEASCSTGKKKSYTSFKEKMKAKA